MLNPNDHAPTITITTVARSTQAVTAPYSVQPPANLTTTWDAVKEYSYDTNILTVVDSFALTLSNVDGRYSVNTVNGKQVQSINIGDTVQLFMEDEAVDGGVKTLRLTGIITGVDSTSQPGAGTQIMVQGADLGWHLQNNSAQLWKNIKRGTWNDLLKMVDPSWGLQPTVLLDNERSRRLNQGGRFKVQQQQAKINAIFNIMVEPGQSIADLMVMYARRDKRLVNVTADGFLMIFTPLSNLIPFLGAGAPPSYSFHHHAGTKMDRDKNNVEAARLRQTIDGRYTQVTCVGQVAYATPLATQDNPTAGKIRQDYFAYDALPFNRSISFSDGEQISRATVKNRAQWKWQRGQFDSWVYEITVKGHSQNGLFYAPDTIASVDDDVLGVKGLCYVSACRYSRTMSEGTRTMLTLHKPNVLGA